MRLQLLLTQHFLAVAADLILRCRPSRGSGHSVIPTSVDFRPTLRCNLNEFTDCGRTLHWVSHLRSRSISLHSRQGNRCKAAKVAVAVIANRFWRRHPRGYSRHINLPFIHCDKCCRSRRRYHTHSYVVFLATQHPMCPVDVLGSRPWRNEVR